MKTKFLSFIAGALTVLMLVALPVSALASDGALSIKAYPIRILVNGQVFAPKDANGNDALVFTYNGTTYAPLRALAEAYDLEVGYDAKSNTATVTNPAKALQPLPTASHPLGRSRKSPSPTTAARRSTPLPTPAPSA